MYRSLVCILLTCAITEVISYKDVEIESGLVRGFTAVDGDYIAFLGIPYAAPPVGTRRFKAPLPPPSWNNVFYANRTVQCPQLGKGDENCLIVNVFTPTRLFNGPLAVLVYIHGGSFLLGSGQTKGAEPLIKQNIIVVTINYRLGALGFLCLGVEEAPGNAGLKDQVAALKWVQRNIEQFGGDLNQVTIYGMSAGGASVNLLILSEMAKNLYNKAIIESGIATAVWSIDAKPIQTALNCVKPMEFKQKNLHNLVDLYQRMPANQLSVTNNEYYQNLTDGTFGFVPCIEKKLFGIKPFIIQTPHQIIKNKAFKKVPMLFIFANLEGLYLKSSDYYKDKMEDNFKDFMMADLVFDTEEIKDYVTHKVRYFYFGNKTIDDNSLVEYLNYFGDTMVLHGLLTSAVTYAINQNQVYLMEFAYKSNLGSYEKFYEHINMAGHGDAIKHVILNKTIRNKDDKEAVDRMAKIVTNFVKFSDPIPSRTEQFPLHWPPISDDHVSYLRFGRELQVLEEPHWKRKVFWQRLYEAYRRDIKPVDTCMI